MSGTSELAGAQGVIFIMISRVLRTRLLACAVLRADRGRVCSARNRHGHRSGVSGYLCLMHAKIRHARSSTAGTDGGADPGRWVLPVLSAGTATLTCCAWCRGGFPGVQWDEILVVADLNTDGGELRDPGGEHQGGMSRTS